MTVMLCRSWSDNPVPDENIEVMPCHGGTVSRFPEVGVFMTCNFSQAVKNASVLSMSCLSGRTCGEWCPWLLFPLSPSPASPFQ